MASLPSPSQQQLATLEGDQSDGGSLEVASGASVALQPQPEKAAPKVRYIKRSKARKKQERGNVGKQGESKGGSGNRRTEQETTRQNNAIQDQPRQGTTGQDKKKKQHEMENKGTQWDIQYKERV